jgi:hypothetical protein
MEQKIYMNKLQGAQTILPILCWLEVVGRTAIARVLYSIHGANPRGRRS